MASSGSSHLEDIDEKFCQCPICLQQYKEPRILPCLHRYCTDCLKQLIERDQETTVVKCPECRDEVPIPTEGVEGFKTDFYMKNIIEHIQLQKSLEPEQLRECFDCSKKLKVTSYCFKCNGFLCKDCHDNHMTKRTLKDHKQHTISVEDLKSNSMPFAKLADLKEAPRCESHLKDFCLLCCKTCNDLPICVTCTYGSHKNHDINDVGTIAAKERENLRSKLNNLNQYREKMLKLPQTLDRVKGELLSNVKDEKENLKIKYNGNMQTVKKEIEKIEQDYPFSQSEIENRQKTQMMESRTKMDEEIKQVTIKYEKLFDEIREECRVKLDNLRQKQEEELQKRKETIAILETEFHTSVNTFEKTQEERLTKLQEIYEQVDSIIERFDNLTTTAHGVLKTKNDWTAVQCVPGICTAIEPMSEDINREFLELETLSKIWFRPPEITEDETSPVNIEAIKMSVLAISGITSSGDGSVIITGCAAENYHSHITVINVDGQVLRQTKLEGARQVSYGFCAILSQFKIAAVWQNNKIGVYDVRDGSYIKKNIGDVTNKSWPASRCVICVATEANDNILVGGINSRDVYVFDDQLNFLYTLTLPDRITYPYHMTMSKDNLLICDIDSKKAYIVSFMKEQGGKVVHEFTKPDFDGDDWSPSSVCTDRKGFIYILWQQGIPPNSGRRVVAQYGQDGSQLLTTKQIGLDDSDALCITTLEIGMKEKLLVATWQSRKLYIYSII